MHKVGGGNYYFKRNSNGKYALKNIASGSYEGETIVIGEFEGSNFHSFYYNGYLFEWASGYVIHPDLTAFPD